jgi:glycosyltransferase involved in cell wall biosynthesis
VSGWRFIPHSFAVASQFVCLELLRRGSGLRLFFEDMPYHNPAWQPMTVIFEAGDDAALRSIPPPPADLRADAELRFGFPFDLLRPGRAARTTVFGTAEYLCVPRANVAGSTPVGEAQRRNDFTILAPSNWAKEGFVRSGVAAERVAVLPLGFDPEVFRPATPEQRAAIRSELGFAPDDFVFYHAGAMTYNKGLRILLPAFARLVRERPNVRLLLKGIDALYDSQQQFERQFGKLEPQLAQAAISGLRYSGEQLSFAGMARLYQAADCYVSPYLAEGFNLPVLEAAACGLPVICTRGGATDDFVSEDFALKISSKLRPVVIEGAPEAMGLLPDPENLLHLMRRATDDAEFRRSARDAGPKYVGARYTWAKMADRLLPFVLTGVLPAAPVPAGISAP